MSTKEQNGDDVVWILLYEESFRRD